jgi:hypothetical protein
MVAIIFTQTQYNMNRGNYAYQHVYKKKLYRLPHSVFMCSPWSSQQTPIIFWYNIKEMIFKWKMCSLYARNLFYKQYLRNKNQQNAHFYINVLI